MGKQATTGVFTKEPLYDCKFDWPDDCKVQCGDKGIVLAKKGTYRTAFFEAFPRNPNTFIRGEGETIEDAERSAWEKYQRHTNCELDHEDPNNFDRRGYRNGAAFCKACGFFKSHCFEPTEKCHNCGKPTYYTDDAKRRWWCEDCAHLIPEEDLSEIQKMLREREE